MLILSALWRQRRGEDCKFEASPGYIVSPRQARTLEQDSISKINNYFMKKTRKGESKKEEGGKRKRRGRGRGRKMWKEKRGSKGGRRGRKEQEEGERDHGTKELRAGLEV